MCSESLNVAENWGMLGFSNDKGKDVPLWDQNDDEETKDRIKGINVIPLISNFREGFKKKWFLSLWGLKPPLESDIHVSSGLIMAENVHNICASQWSNEVLRILYHYLRICQLLFWMIEFEQFDLPKISFNN